MTAAVGFMRSQRGVALLVTLAVTTLLVTMALEYNRRARYDVIAAAAARDYLTMAEMATAGVHVAMAILAKDKTLNDTDTPMDDWSDPEKITEALSAKNTAGETLMSYLNVGSTESSGDGQTGAGATWNTDDLVGYANWSKS